MVLGKNELAGTMYRANEYTVSLSDQDLEPLLSKAVQNLPENIMSVMVDNRTLEIESASSPCLMLTRKNYIRVLCSWTG